MNGAPLLVVAGFLAGAVNAVSGGGSLISFPALLAVGYPAVSANVTNTVAIWPGYLSSAIGYRADLDGQRPRMLALGVTTIVGAICGATILLTAPKALFRAVVPWLLLLAAALLAVQPRLAVRVQKLKGGSGEHRSVLLHVGSFLGAVYGAYFGAGVSVLLLGVLGLFLPDRIHRLNALRSILVLIVNTVAMVVFALFGPVAWGAVAVMSAASLLGGWTGAKVARRLDASALRAAVVVIAVAVAVVLLIRL
ncbi:MAG: uncharacterized protein QOG43_378 [Actinomycetota bacterium]|nr:uncharacterized protein [Actinomycetota bacterium]